MILGAVRRGSAKKSPTSSPAVSSHKSPGPYRLSAMFANLSIENELVDALPTSPAEALPPPPPPPESPINSFDNDDCEFDSLNCAEAPFFLSNCEDTDDSSTAADKVGIDVAVGSEEAHGAVQKAHQHFLEEVRHLETELDVVVAAVASATSISYE